MPDANSIIAAIEAHCQTLSDHDKDGWLALWAEDAILEDPVGVDTFRGRGYPDDLLENGRGSQSDEALAGARHHRVRERSHRNSARRGHPEGSMQHVGPLVDHFTFNDAGQISMMRAFWKYA